MAEKNSTILDKVWLEGSTDYQQRVPQTTQAGIARTVETLFKPGNADLYNHFINVLINRIGSVIVHQSEWRNPLAGFKQAPMSYGNTIQEIAPKWVKAHSYQFDSTLLDWNSPEVQAWYHSINRRDVYPIDIQMDMVRTSFDEEYGLNQLIQALLITPLNSDYYDEYRIMLQLIAEYQHRWGFFTVNLDNNPFTEEGAKEFLTLVRAFTGRLQFPSTLYNAKVFEDIPVFAQPDELMLLVNPETEAYLDVNVLASLFHVELADINVRRIIIDDFPIPYATGLLTTRDWFVCKDTVYRTETFFDPSNLMNKYYLHHQGIYSMSPFVPAILFTYGSEGTVVNSAKQTITGLTVTAEQETVDAGGTVELYPVIAGTVEGSDKLTVVPDSVTYKVTSDADLNSRTYVTDDNILHVQKYITDGAVLTITATSTYIDPSGVTETYTAECSVTVTGGVSPTALKPANAKVKTTKASKTE